MKKEGFVSLFIGNSDSYEELQKYVLVSYTEDGDAIPSKFEKDFGIEYYDEDFREVEFYSQSSNDLRVLLEGFSYDEEIAPEFIDICGERLDQEVNSVILLYNFQYDRKVDKTNQFKFLGTVQYK
ncbi:immunity protein 22 of polymorphic toxin system [Laceyella sediminis]|uniref:Immunity protein 22 of polymorphic toxin system n=1 Tax=Laceyella sediminis TaxID=573074 RepID=A0ABX5EJF3_9BACL|nr:immunity 22 family protein [Laceyella sediminis]PRZ11692.1 immunity protein 22 of polymorphic toxin system [Laceyella sediminis]